MAAVFFDIDGTLWDKDNIIPESTKSGIQKLKENGHSVFLCSGRTRIFITNEQLLTLGFDGILCGCGTHVEYHGEDLLYHKIEDSLMEKSVNLFYEYGMPMVMEGRYLLYMDPEIISRDPYGRYLLESLKGNTMPIRGNQKYWEASKFSVLIENTNYQEVIEALSEYYDFLVHGSFVMEVVPKGFSKATSIELICEKLGIDRSDTYAFGDSANDMEMLKYVGCGIAMGNATPQVKKIADYVTEDLHSDGIYLALEHFGLI